MCNIKQTNTSSPYSGITTLQPTWHSSSLYGYPHLCHYHQQEQPLWCWWRDPRACCCVSSPPGSCAAPPSDWTSCVPSWCGAGRYGRRSAGCRRLLPSCLKSPVHWARCPLRALRYYPGPDPAASCPVSQTVSDLCRCWKACCCLCANKRNK